MIIRFLYIVLAFIFVAAPQIAAAQSPAQYRVAPSNHKQIQLSFAPVVKQIAPSVVNIYTKRTVARRVGNAFFNDPFFNNFFGGSRGFGQQLRKQVESSLGSGVIIAKDGLIVTNAHVIKGAEEIKVVLGNGREFDARSTVIDEPSDLALLRIIDAEEETFPFATLRPSESLEVGDIVLAIGNPFGVGQSVSSGIVSAQGRSSLDINDFNFFIQTDAAINPGNSGGPLVSLDGKVVGINTAIYSRDGGSLGLGFAVPSEMLASIIAAEKTEAKTGTPHSKNSRIIRPWLGITAQKITSEIAESLGLETPKGALVAELHPHSPLKTAGLKIGDVVTELNGYKIKDAGEMRFRMATVPLGDRATVKALRRNKEWSFQVKAIAPPDKPDRDQRTLSGVHPLNGVTIANLNPAVVVELGLSISDEQEGVIVMESPARSRFGVAHAGDILLKINDYEIKKTKDVEKALEKNRGKGWIFTLKRDGQVRQILIR